MCVMEQVCVYFFVINFFSHREKNIVCSQQYVYAHLFPRGNLQSQLMKKEGWYV